MNALTNKLNAFFDKRAKVGDIAQLGLNNVYVFFSKQGTLFLLLLLTTFITGTNYGNNLILGVFFYMFSVWVVSSFVTFSQLSKLTIKLQSISLAASDDVAWVEIAIDSKDKLAHQIELFFDDKRDDNALSDNNKTLLAQQSKAIIARIDGSSVVKLPVMTTKRGMMKLPRLVIKSQYPLGVVMAWSYVRFQQHAWVYPKPISFDWQLIKNSQTGEQGHKSNYYKKGQDDFDMLDSYQQGESLARVSWSHFARGMGMLSKQFADQVGEKRQLNYHDMPAIHHEDKLAQLSFAILALASTNTPFMLSMPNQSTAIGTGDDFIHHCLLLLAKSE